MSAVSISTLQPLFQKYDADQNGKMTQVEIAKAALDLKSQSKTDGDTFFVQAQLFSTFVQGGVNKNGLLPDIDKDGNLSLAELTDLGKQGGDLNAIEASDFQKGFGNAAVAGGNTIDIEKLKELANSKPVEPPPPQPDFSQFLKLILSLFTLLMGQLGRR